MDRREFIMGTTAALALPAVAGAGRGGVGVQLYSVRDLMAEDVYATLDLIAGIGYREVQFAGYFSQDPAKLRKHLDDVDLAAPAAHVSYSIFEENMNMALEFAHALGHSYINAPSVPDHRRGSLDDFRKHAENFNRWGEKCREAGLQFAYHNHEWEFAKIDGVVPFDLLLENTDPALVKYEMDLAWVTKGGFDPVAYFEAWPGRFPMWHLKDLSADGHDADIGTGSVDFERAFANADLAGLKHGFVERDSAADPQAAVERNYEAILPYWESL